MFIAEHVPCSEALIESNRRHFNNNKFEDPDQLLHMPSINPFGGATLTRLGISRILRTGNGIAKSKHTVIGEAHLGY